MKTKMNGIIKGLIIIVVLLMVPMIVTANGEMEKNYPEVLEAEFTDIAEALEVGDIDRAEALEQLNALRNEYGREDNEDYQTMEGLLIAVQTQTMEKEQALVQLRQLNECKDEGSELKTQEKVENKTQTKLQAATPTQVPVQTKTQLKTSQGSSDGSDSGTSSGGSSSKK